MVNKTFQGIKQLLDYTIKMRKKEKKKKNPDPPKPSNKRQHLSCSFDIAKLLKKIDIIINNNLKKNGN